MSSLLPNYEDWRMRLCKLNEWLFFIILLIELIISGVLASGELIQQEVAEYWLVYFVVPTVLNGTAIILERVLMKYFRGNDAMLNAIPVVVLTYVFTVVASIHCVFSATLCLLAIPIFVTVLYSDKRLCVQSVVGAVTGVLIAVLLRRFTELGHSVDPYLIPDAVIALAFVLSAGRVAYFLTEQLNEQNEKLLKATADAREAEEKAETANRAKSDFLSTMSHEIRTPMNVIIGLTNILLRRERSEEDRGYLENIRNSGNALLTIINDILDFSKIESGKMELVEEEYAPMSLLSDMSLMFWNRIGSKDIELLYDIDEKLPSTLYGDSLRIRQIITNLVNNAVKFTDQGFVKLTVRFEKVDDENAKLHMSVEDSGQGIRQEDLGKLFKSFEQVDAKRNHHKEGTGLGLAICYRLVSMMDGTIGVESVYGEGSVFSFTICQKLRGEEPAASLNPETRRKSHTISLCMENVFLRENVESLAGKYGIGVVSMEEVQNADVILADETDYGVRRAEFESLAKSGKEVVVLQNPMCESICSGKGIASVHKPLYSLNFCQLLNHEKVHNGQSSVDQHMNFTAPEARILLVEDNELNSQVALALLEPLKMQIDVAENGQVALNMIRKKHYDLVFMDHMMPVMNGVEATIELRKMPEEYYQKLPVIALTANAVADAKAQFLACGMNDFTAKPIVMKDICHQLKRWLPKGKIVKGTPGKPQSNGNLEAPVNANGIGVDGADINSSGTAGDGPGTREGESALSEIEGLDVQKALEYCGSLDLFHKLLGNYYKVIDQKASKIRKLLEDDMIRDYVIEVHAQKNAARMIGATKLSEWFFKMEQCGNAGDVETLKQETEGLLSLFTSYKKVLEPFGRQQDSEAKEVPAEKLIELLKQIHDGADVFDLDAVDAAMKELETCILPQELLPAMEKLRTDVADVTLEDILSGTQEMIVFLRKME